MIGAGLWGCTIAERIASVLKEKVLIIDKRDHLGGNCHSRIHSETGIEYHVYGSHIFHTSLENVWSYITQFTRFSDYRHSVYTQFKDRVYNFPVNLKTINDFYSKNLKPYEVQDFIKEQASSSKIHDPKNLEEKAISLIGRPLYEAFVEGYTKKQWQTDPKNLPKEIIQRLPIRNTYENGYFVDKYQGLPEEGYFKLFENMVKNPLIEVQLNTSWEDIRDVLPEERQIFYSGPIDGYFNYKAGELAYRSLKFESEVKNVVDWQGCSVLNYADKEIPYTRIHEFKHLHPERKSVFESSKTLLYYEYSIAGSKENDFYYPVNTQENQKILACYKEMADSLENVVISGRLGSYRYLDMDKVIADALECFNKYTLKHKVN